MNLSISSLSYPLTQYSHILLKKILNPLCGVVQEMGFIRRASRESRVIISGADLTGVHILLNQPHPGRGAYHIGGAGLHLNEAIIKTLAESLERYSQLVAG